MRKIIYTVSVGDDRCFDYCIESQKKYAKKVKADFFVRLNWQNWNDDLKTDCEKRFCVDLLKYYDKVLYLDADVLIKHNASDIFDYYKNNNNLVIYNEVLFNDVNMDAPIKACAEKHNINWHKTNGHYDWLNAGVMLLSKGHEKIFNYDPERFFKFPSHPHIYDMPYMHYNIYTNKIKVTFMEERYNTMIYFHDKGEFLHFANVNDRNERINSYV